MARKDTRDVGGEQLTDSQILERANAVLKTALFYTRDGHVLAAAAEILKLSDPVRAARCDRIARNLLGAVATPRADLLALPACFSDRLSTPRRGPRGRRRDDLEQSFGPSCHSGEGRQ